MYKRQDEGCRAGAVKRNPSVENAQAQLRFTGWASVESPTLALAVGEQIDDYVADRLTGKLAAATTVQYAAWWDRWVWYCKTQKRESPILLPHAGNGVTAAVVEAEDVLLRYAGYLAWLGKAAGTVRTALFAIQAAHKRAGAGDPMEGMSRLWFFMDRLKAVSYTHLTLPTILLV